MSTLVLNPSYDRRLRRGSKVIQRNMGPFQEFLDRGFIEARVAERYFLGDNGHHITQKEVAGRFGFSSASVISLYISSFLHVLDPSFPAGYVAQARARRIARDAKRMQGKDHIGSLRVSPEERARIRMVATLLERGGLDALRPILLQVVELRCQGKSFGEIGGELAIFRQAAHVYWRQVVAQLQEKALLPR
ncbi:hypothetical protein KKI17_02685 [Patescibacteria group bacterium]|nr:hypothetical protein [Patescibacteria group bacterium]